MNDNLAIVITIAVVLFYEVVSQAIKTYERVHTSRTVISEDNTKEVTHEE